MYAERLEGETLFDGGVVESPYHSHQLLLLTLIYSSPFSRDIPETRVALHLAVDCPRTWLASYLSYLAALVHSSYPPGQTDIWHLSLHLPTTHDIQQLDT